MKLVSWIPGAVPDLMNWVRCLASTSTYAECSWRDLSKGRWEAKNHGLGKYAVLRPPSLEEEASASVPKSVKDNKRKRASTSEDPKSKTRIARKPRKNTIPLTIESVLHLRDEDEEEEEENDGSVLVARVKKTIDAPKEAESMVIYKALPHTEEISEEGSSRVPESLEIEDASHRSQQMARLASELAKAKSDAEKAKANADAFVAIYRADAEAAQVQARKAAKTANTRAHWVAELAKCRSQRETLEEIHAQGSDLAGEIKRAKELEVDAEALAFDDDDDGSKSGSESGEEPNGEDTAPGDSQET
ncbi:uncharacterized protein [Nicotiana tomentosiformis]|uniref:uncharacterized protein n=1 Tax=Nicotiana tomentosiformis TaxID=4098 RepID=UPI00388C9C1F